MTDFSAFDIGDANPAPTDKLEKIVKIATESVELERNIGSTMELLEALSGRSTELKTRALPDAMAEAQMSNFSLEDGTTIKVDDFVSGSLPKEEPERGRAIKFLEDNEAGSLIKNVMTVSFEKSQHEEATALANRLRSEGYDVEVKSDVHPQTYMAWARDALKQGVNLDPDLLNLFIGRVAKLDIPGFKKPSKSKKKSKS